MKYQLVLSEKKGQCVIWIIIKIEKIVVLIHFTQNDKNK